jgi:sulfate adenylyltransferase
MKLKISYSNFLDIINIHFKCYLPLTKFVSEKEFLSIINNYQIKKNHFFPLPIYISVSKIDYLKIKKLKKVQAIYKNRKICELKIFSIFTLDKKKIGKKIFKTKDNKHPGFNQFINSGEYFLNCSIKNFNISVMKKINYTYPEKFKNKIRNSKIKSLVAFHTRNAPHKGHEWIHRHALSKCNGLLIQPLIGQFKKGEFKEKIIIRTNKALIKKIYRNKNVYFALFNSYPRYAGPREALLHALVRRNYGCTHFLVGRDHAGIKNYYKKYESQSECLKYQKKLKIKIIKFNEPFLCFSCRKVMNKKCNNCGNTIKKLISGTYIRKKILKNKKIPDYYMSKSISKILNKKSII